MKTLKQPPFVPGTNGGSLRSRSTASEQRMFGFGPRMQFLCVKLGKIWLKQPPFVPGTFLGERSVIMCI
jgi:hypothetical protein